MTEPEQKLSLNVTAVAKKLATARCVAVVTGAGVSAESGIRTFRDTMEGLWKEFDAKKLATPEAFDADPATVSRWYDHRRLGCLAAEPNPGHLALAAIERNITSRGGEFHLFTQNVDRLHQRAMTSNVIELHGNIMEWRCTQTGELILLPPEAMTVYPAPSPFSSGSLLRPNVVWFGEALPEEALIRAYEVFPRADFVMTVGTSATVYPAAGLIELCDRLDATRVEVNKDATPASRHVDYSFRGASGDLLPRLVRAAWPPNG